MNREILIQPHFPLLAAGFTAHAHITKAVTKNYALEASEDNIASPVYHGVAVDQKSFELMPFENEWGDLKINESPVEKSFNFIAEKEEVPVAGVSFRIKSEVAANNNDHLLQSKFQSHELTRQNTVILNS